MKGSEGDDEQLSSAQVAVCRGIFGINLLEECYTDPVMQVLIWCSVLLLFSWRKLWEHQVLMSWRR